MEKIPTTARNPTSTGKLPFQLNIPQNREDSINEAENAKEDIHVYSDGSAINGKVGAAAVLIRPGDRPRMLHLHLGPESEHTVHEAELVGILLGIHLMATEKQGKKSFMVGVDNQAAIQAFQSDLRSPAHHLAREVICVANQLQKRRRKSRYSLILRWTAGHEGIAGNEEADREAKRAAEGHSSDKKLLPSYLRKPLLINLSAVKRTYQDKLKRKWAEEWRNSPRGKRALHIDKSTPSKKFLGSISNSELSREAASRIAQFRLAHAPVNQYLKRIGKVDNARCPACGADEETIEHFLLYCPSYAHKRWAINQHAKHIKKQFTLSTLLDERDMMIPLTNYIDATGRFKDKGEHNNH